MIRFRSVEAISGIGIGFEIASFEEVDEEGDGWYILVDVFFIRFVFKTGED